MKNSYFPNLKNLVWVVALVFVSLNPLMLGRILISDCAMILLQCGTLLEVYEEIWPHTNTYLKKNILIASGNCDCSAWFMIKTSEPVASWRVGAVRDLKLAVHFVLTLKPIWSVLLGVLNGCPPLAWFGNSCIDLLENTCSLKVAVLQNIDVLLCSVLKVFS